MKKIVPFPEASDLAPRHIDLSQPFVVRSLNCTTNKPLHLGHLRNMILGAAMANSLEALGARVLRHCILEDTGRFMTEAMAAVRDFENSGESLENLQLKPDHFIGSCYRRHRQKITAAAGSKNTNSPSDGSAATGYEARSDEADDLMRALMRGEEEALSLRARVREMALEGQQATLQRIGVTFDRCDYESAEDPVLDDFLNACSERGLLQRNEKGELSYHTSQGRDLRLINSIGLAEESTHLVSFNKRLADTEMANHVTIIMAGSEWKRSMMAYAELLARLGAETVSKLYAPMFYGMVMLDGKKMASSTGTGLLVDDLVDQMAADERIVELSRQCYGNGDRADEFVGTIAKCFLLSFGRTNKIDFTFTRLNSSEVNPGWHIAEAWVALKRDDSLQQTRLASYEARRILLDALSRVSFEDVIERTKEIADRILARKASDADKSDFITMVTALSVVPGRSEFRYSNAPSLAFN